MRFSSATAILPAILHAADAPGSPGPALVNGSFEADRLDTHPGYARSISGWTHTGNVGLNPWWLDPKAPAGPQRPFADNGRIPHGRQVALLQNICTLSQSIPGFEKGKRYQVTYFENARHNRQPGRHPRITLLLGGETIVSPHAIEPVEGYEVFTLPYNFVESALFTAPASGAFDLVFRTLEGDRVTALIDDVRIAEVAPGQPG
ncbi:MAG: hypothetical protein JXR94_08725 [Candidatus Hydrogenedentes bacterium]|nr:hypothetical protein [Candidatus Hydrogenedentota bacterium]